MKQADYINLHTHRPTPTERTLQSVGVHPWEALSPEVEAHLAAVVRAVDADPAVEAVGEIGLDWVRATTPDARAAQERIFTQQLALAERRSKIVVLHCVRAFEEVIRKLAECRLQGVVFHGFIGSPQQAARAVARGYYLSFGTPALRSPRTIETLRSIPRERLFLETDDREESIAACYAAFAPVLEVEIAQLRALTAANFARLLQHEASLLSPEARPSTGVDF